MNFEFSHQLRPIPEGHFDRYSPRRYSQRPDQSTQHLAELAKNEAIGKGNWPISSRFYDPLTMDPTHISNLLRNDTQFTTDSLPWFLEYAYSNDNFAIHQSRLEDAHENSIFNTTVLESPLTVVHVGQERLYFEDGTISQISLNAPTWMEMLERFNVLPSFLELLHDNQGGSLAHISYDRADTLQEPSSEADAASCDKPQALHVGYKIGNGAVKESAIYARHDFSTGRTLVMLFSTSTSLRLTRLQHLFRAWPAAGLFHLVFALLSITLEAIEETRWWLDYQTQALEWQTGITAGTMHGTEPVDAERLKFNKKLLIMAEHSMFVEGASKRIHSNFGSLLDHMSAYEETCRSIDVAHHVLENLRYATKLKSSLAEHQYGQAKQLEIRLQTQLDITKLLIAQRDNQLNIELARAAKVAGEVNLKIAEATMHDSQLMRGIAAVTMIFLPATFVATFFSMVFFHVGNESSVRLTIDQQIWLYPTVTLPLTLLVTIWYWTRAKYLPRKQQNLFLQKSDSLAA